MSKSWRHDPDDDFQGDVRSRRKAGKARRRERRKDDEVFNQNMQRDDADEHHSRRDHRR